MFLSLTVPLILGVSGLVGYFVIYDNSRFELVRYNDMGNNLCADAEFPSHLYCKLLATKFVDMAPPTTARLCDRDLRRRRGFCSLVSVLRILP